MNFWDIDPMELPEDAYYYFGCALIIAEGRGGVDMWDLSHVHDARPYAICLINEDIDTRITVLDEVVIEVWNGEVSWYSC